MKNFWKYFGVSTIFSIAALVGAFLIGYFFGELANQDPKLAHIDPISAGFTAVFTTFMLGILETSLSFDNAVINAKVLETMTPFWQKMFLTIGMIIAVFGMRIIFPLAIVWILSGQGFGDVLAMTWQNPQGFQKIIEDEHTIVAGFGGAFLWMVFTKFFFDHNKEVHWIPGLEKVMGKLGRMEALWVGLTMIITIVFYNLIPESTPGHDTHKFGFLSSAMLGVITYILVDGLSSLLEKKEESIEKKGPNNAIKAVAMGGFGTFMYLEVLDASFSFDGVIGAFAITNNLYIIALGLGIGAFFVRSLTIKLVRDKTLGKYKYLEHGAFWAIGALSLIMYLTATGIKIPEAISGSVGLVFISLSVLTSVLANKREQKNQASN